MATIINIIKERNELINETTLGGWGDQMEALDTLNKFENKYRFEIQAEEAYQRFLANQAAIKVTGKARRRVNNMFNTSSNYESTLFDILHSGASIETKHFALDRVERREMPINWQVCDYHQILVESKSWDDELRGRVMTNVLKFNLKMI